MRESDVPVTGLHAGWTPDDAEAETVRRVSGIGDLVKSNDAKPAWGRVVSTFGSGRVVEVLWQGGHTEFHLPSQIMWVLSRDNTT